MKLSLCVVNYRSEEELKNFLESIEAHRPDCLFEVIVVDNSQSDLKHLKDEFGHWVHVISPQKNLGYGQGHNRAVKQARGEYVLLCNPDLELHDGSLQLLLRHADKLKDFGIIGPQLFFDDGQIQDSYRRFPRFRDLLVKRLGLSLFFKETSDRYLMKDAFPQESMKVDWLVGAALLMKREVFERVGGFDRRFFLFFEDTDLCRKVWDAGLDVWYFPEASLLHRRQRLSESVWPGFWLFKKVFWYHLLSAGKYFWKWRRKGIPRKEDGFLA